LGPGAPERFARRRSSVKRAFPLASPPRFRDNRGTAQEPPRA